jgi:hypothetical protein
VTAKQGVYGHNLKLVDAHRVLAVDPKAGARMINLDTTFVVGAGASIAYGFPSGEALTKQIAQALTFISGTGSSEAKELIRTTIDVVSQRPDLQLNKRHLFEQALAMRGALETAPSIDTFLETHANKDFELLGKLAIAACLITAESRCTQLRPQDDGSINLAAVADTWLGHLFKHVLTPGIPKSSVEQIFAHVSFVVFNYDRCIEHYFEHALARHFLLDLPKASRIVQQLRIVHPYGDLGPLHGAQNVSFGQKHTPESYAAADAIYAMSQRLLTFTESQEAKGAEARDLIHKAKRVVFLGFGFGEQNVELLRAPSKTTVDHMKATVMGLSPSDQQEVVNRIGLITGGSWLPSSLNSCDCAKFMQEERMFLTRRA